MRSYFKYLSLLIPLAVLLALPCATKRQIKQNVGAEQTEVATNKGENEKFCISTFVEKDQIEHTLKRLITDTPIVSSTNLILPFFSSIVETSGLRSLDEKTSVIPLFLLYRKLIIYF